MAYPTRAALVAASSVAELTGLEAPEQDSLWAAAISAVEEFCGQTFGNEDRTEIIDGRGASVIYLPARLSRLDSLRVNGQDFATASVVISSERDRLHFNTEYALGYYEQAIADASGDKFPVGFGNIEINGLWGWADDEFPAAVGTALRYDMEDTALADQNSLSATVQAFRKLGLRNISQGNLQAQITSAPGLTDRVTRILRPYVWNGQIGALV